MPATYRWDRKCRVLMDGRIKDAARAMIAGQHVRLQEEGNPPQLGQLLEPYVLRGMAEDLRRQARFWARADVPLGDVEMHITELEILLQNLEKPAEQYDSLQREVAAGCLTMEYHGRHGSQRRYPQTYLLRVLMLADLVRQDSLVKETILRSLLCAHGGAARGPLASHRSRGFSVAEGPARAELVSRIWVRFALFVVFIFLFAWSRFSRNVGHIRSD